MLLISLAIYLLAFTADSDGELFTAPSNFICLVVAILVILKIYVFFRSIRLANKLRGPGLVIVIVTATTITTVFISYCQYCCIAGSSISCGFGLP